MKEIARKPEGGRTVVCLAALLWVCYACGHTKEHLREMDNRFHDMNQQVESLTYKQEQIKQQRTEVISDIQSLLQSATTVKENSPSVNVSSQSISSASATNPNDIQSVSLDDTLDPSVPAPDPPPGAMENASFTEAYTLYSRGDYTAAAQAFLQAHDAAEPQEIKAICLYWVGESYCRNKEWEKSLQLYIRIEKEHPGSPLLPSVYLKSGYAFINLGQPDKGRQILEFLVNQYPQSEEARLAKEQLQ